MNMFLFAYGTLLHYIGIASAFFSNIWTKCWILSENISHLNAFQSFKTSFIRVIVGNASSTQFKPN